MRCDTAAKEGGASEDADGARPALGPAGDVLDAAEAPPPEEGRDAVVEVALGVEGRPAVDADVPRLVGRVPLPEFSFFFAAGVFLSVEPASIHRCSSLLEIFESR